MTQTAYLWDPISLKHDTGLHVEKVERAERLCPDRIREKLPNIAYPVVESHDALEAIIRVHYRGYYDFVHAFCHRGGGFLDAADTIVCRDSFDAAIGSVNTALTAVDLVFSRRARNVFSAMRPPGHHALPDRAMGFCIFGNIAIAARHAQQVHGIDRVAIVDFDVHHGNGTQDIFYDDGSVFFVSMHQHPLWPMTGLARERGVDAGEGTTLNLPVHPGTGEAEQLKAFTDTVIPAVHEFHPELLLISAGFDAHRDDPLAELNMTESGYARMTRELMDLAADCCQGRIVSLLEGGYNLTALENSVVAHVNELAS
ncbi:MAG: histone deacetylase [Phycisphaerales bacterium]|nr:histone deacetylase [Phycisphaerales bacterium]MCB9854343.1 histone deacetylase [Phycisphaerales bacterium]MCB9863544.1 histone deacetylase [Phycisphaerales bacterium]